eukprot:scaffold308167_cov17-Prasinocladus_malaysianus.AAC.1
MNVARAVPYGCYSVGSRPQTTLCSYENYSIEQGSNTSTSTRTYTCCAGTVQSVSVSDVPKPVGPID